MQFLCIFITNPCPTLGHGPRTRSWSQMSYGLGLGLGLGPGPGPGPGPKLVAVLGVGPGRGRFDLVAKRCDLYSRPKGHFLSSKR